MSSLNIWAPFCAMALPMWTILSPWSKQSYGCSYQGCKATNHTGLRNLPNLASGIYTNTRRNPPEPSGICLRTYTSIRPNPPQPSWTFRNLHQHTPEPSGTFRNPPPEPTPTYAGTLRNLPEPASGTYTSTRRNSPEPSGTFWNLPPEPAPATRTSTHRGLFPTSVS